jgi:phospholipase C
VEDSWSVRDTYGWYDLSVSSDSNAAFMRRLAGRVESGKPSVSDPATA